MAWLTSSSTGRPYRRAGEQRFMSPVILMRFLHVHGKKEDTHLPRIPMRINFHDYKNIG
jgi:hypothetical protein